MRKYSIYFIVLMFYITQAQASDGVFFSCKAGSVNGDRTEVTADGSIQVDDRVDLNSMSYVTDPTSKTLVTVKHGEKEYDGFVLNSNRVHGWVTIVYVINGVSYMDTLFLKLGKVISSEHKMGWLGATGVAANWKINSCNL